MPNDHRAVQKETRPQQVQNAEDITVLQTEAVGLSSAVIELSKKFDISSQQVKALRNLTKRVTIFLVVFVVASVILGVLIFQQVSKNNEFLRQGNSARGAIFEIDDCIKPTGTCAKRQQEQTGKIIGRIVDSNKNGKPDTQEILNAIKKLEAQRRAR